MIKSWMKKCIFISCPIIFLMVLFLVYIDFVESPLRKSHFQQTEMEAKKIVAAIERYHSENTKYPEKLEDLVPAYLQELVKPKWGDSGWMYIGSETGFYLEVGNISGIGSREYPYPSLSYSTSRGWYLND